MCFIAERVRIFYSVIKTWEHFDSNTARPIVPLQSAALRFGKLTLIGYRLVRRNVKVITQTQGTDLDSW